MPAILTSAKVVEAWLRNDWCQANAPQRLLADDRLMIVEKRGASG